MRTDMRNLTKGIAAAALLAILAACGSGFGSSGSVSGSSSGSSSVRIGNGTGSSFVAGVLALGVSSISAGGATSITVNLVDSSGTLYSQPATITFNSPCLSSGEASITDSTGATTNSVSADSGTAIVTYTAKGCSGTDTVTATTTINGVQLTATADITIQAATLGSIQFVSATPKVITLKGMGGAGLQETSAVIFAVKDSVGGAVKGATVKFSLNTSVGGVTLSTATAVSDANGDVQTIVRSGTFPGPVIVTASVDASGTTISTQSSQLTINSGVPTQNHFSLSIDTFNVEGFTIDGNQATLTARLADRFGNPVPDGTPVSFIQADSGFGAGGSVQGSCTTTGGVCSVTWTSQNPRPFGAAGEEHIGFAYVLAFAQGEESFTDQNADGVLDKFKGVIEPFSDIGEIFAPSAEFATSGATSSFVSGEKYYDFDKSGDYTPADGKWEGVNCKAGTSCGTRKSAGVGSYMCIVMGASDAEYSDAAVNGTATNFGNASTTTFSGGTLLAPSVSTVSVAIGDSNNNVLPEGTTIKLDTTNLQGATATLSPSTGGTYTVGNVSCGSSKANWPARFVITVVPGTSPTAGNIDLQVITPSNTQSDLVITVN